jgi:hypothetical protein
VPTLLKSIPFGVALTMILSFIATPYGTYDHYLGIHQVTWSYFEFYWSWEIFIITFVLAWLLFWLIE